MGGTIARIGSKYHTGSLTMYARPEQMREWHERAAPGDRCIYAIGPDLGADAAASLAREFSDARTVHLSRQRDGNAWRYFMERRPAADAPAPTRLSIEDARVLALLADAAARGRLCPTNSEIADLLNLVSRFQARDRFNALVRAGEIKVIAQGSFGRRVIEIVTSGERTADVSEAR